MSGKRSQRESEVLSEWAQQVFDLIKTFGESQFETKDVYTFEKTLKQLHPNNNNIQAKIRQIIADLKTKNYLVMCDGKYQINNTEAPAKTETPAKTVKTVKRAKTEKTAEETLAEFVFVPASPLKCPPPMDTPIFTSDFVSFGCKSFDVVSFGCKSFDVVSSIQQDFLKDFDVQFNFSSSFEEFLLC